MASSSFLLRMAFCFDKSLMILSCSSLVLKPPTLLFDFDSYLILNISFSILSILSSSSAILSSFSSNPSSGAPMQFVIKALILSSFYSTSISKHFMLFFKRAFSALSFDISGIESGFCYDCIFTPESYDFTPLDVSSLFTSALSI